MNRRAHPWRVREPGSGSLSESAAGAPRSHLPATTTAAAAFIEDESTYQSQTTQTTATGSSLPLLLSPSSRLSSESTRTRNSSSSSSSPPQLLFSITTNDNRQAPGTAPPRCHRRRSGYDHDHSSGTSVTSHCSHGHETGAKNIGANNSNSIGRDEHDDHDLISSTRKRTRTTSASISTPNVLLFNQAPFSGPLLLLDGHVHCRRSRSSSVNGLFRNCNSSSFSTSAPASRLLPNNSKKMEAVITDIAIPSWCNGRSDDRGAHVGYFVQLITILSKLLLLHFYHLVCSLPLRLPHTRARAPSGVSKSASSSVHSTKANSKSPYSSSLPLLRLQQPQTQLRFMLPIFVFMIMTTAGVTATATAGGSQALPSTGNSTINSVNESSTGRNVNSILPPSIHQQQGINSIPQIPLPLPSTSPSPGPSSNHGRARDLKDSSGHSVNLSQNGGYTVFLDNKRHLQADTPTQSEPQSSNRNRTECGPVEQQSSVNVEKDEIAPRGTGPDSPDSDADSGHNSNSSKPSSTLVSGDSHNKYNNGRKGSSSTSPNTNTSPIESLINTSSAPVPKSKPKPQLKLKSNINNSDPNPNSIQHVNEFTTKERELLELGDNGESHRRVSGEESLHVHLESGDVDSMNGEDLLSSENHVHYYTITNSSSISNSIGLGIPAEAEARVDNGQTFSNFYVNNTQQLRILSQIRRDLSQRIGRGSTAAYSGKVARVVTHEQEEFEQDDLDVQECDRVFVSTPTSKNGTFESPKLIAEDDHSIQCIFTFVPRPGERVQIAFKSFNVRGIPPECVHEWIDLYTEVDGTDVTDLISTPFAGRYCGLIPPRPRISLFGGIAIGFYSDRNVTDDDEVRFSGLYSFISDDRYVVGTPVPRTICSFTIYGSSKRQGELRSPTYPGIYPKDLSCTYKFIGTVGQRIRIEFRDFDVFSGGPSCPFDDVKVYDGMDTEAPLIGTYCGPQRYLVIFSSTHLMFVTFTTRERTFESQNRGFTALWEFSESFVKLDFIGKNAGEHIRGTECDQLILSKGQSQGAVYSPNYPFPYLPKIYCKYFIYGLQDAQHLERVKLSFEKFDVPSSTHSEEDLSSHHKEKDSKCGDGHVKIYVKAQEVIGGFDKPDYEFCGKDIPEEISSDQPRLVLAFSSGEIQGSGFKAKYAFEIEYKVPGTPAPDHSCHFTYLSSTAKHGDFNSPRYPSNYPSNMTCTYSFIAIPNTKEQIRIVFDHFKLRNDKVNYTGGAYGNEICIQDFVEIYNVFKEGKTQLIGRYCSRSAPGPIESHEEAEAVTVVLHLDEEGVYSGFKARYSFFMSKSLFGECGMNYSSTLSGTLTSPGWPGMYEGPKTKEGSFRCNWFLDAKPGNRILLHFEIFSIEGHPNDRGCPAAAVRVWEDPSQGLPTELCGEDLTPEQTQFISVKNTMRVTFITADKAVGNRGFAAVWSEVHDRIGSSSCQANFIPCSKAPYCIPEGLICDGVKNCGIVDGETDDSDESICGLDGEVNVIIIMVLSIAGGSCCLLILCFWGQRKRRKRRRRMQLRRPPIHVCDNAGARFAAMDSV